MRLWGPTNPSKPTSAVWSSLLGEGHVQGGLLWGPPDRVFPLARKEMQLGSRERHELWGPAVLDLPAPFWAT